MHNSMMTLVFAGVIIRVSKRYNKANNNLLGNCTEFDLLVDVADDLRVCVCMC